MKVKKYVVTMLFTLLCVMCMPKDVMAAGGPCGLWGENNATWTYKDGVITISGTGEVNEAHEEGDVITEVWNTDFYMENTTKVVINEGITSLTGWYLFKDFKNLTSVSLPDSLTYMGIGNFENCTSLKSITIPKNLSVVASDNFKNSGIEVVTFSEGMKEVPSTLFTNATNLKTVYFPQSIEKIEASAFTNCTGLTQITLPHYMKEISYNVFEGCTNLQEIIIYQNVDAIGYAAFKDVKNLTIYGKKNSYAHKYAKENGYTFKACKVPALKGVTYTKENLKYQVIDDYIDGNGTVMVIGMKKNASSVTLPKMVKLESYKYKVVEINNNAFKGKSGLKKITIKSTYLTAVGKNAIKGINKNAIIKVPKSKVKAYKKLFKTKTGYKKTMKITK